MIIGVEEAGEGTDAARDNESLVTNRHSVKEGGN